MSIVYNSNQSKKLIVFETEDCILPKFENISECLHEYIDFTPDFFNNQKERFKHMISLLKKLKTIKSKYLMYQDDCEDRVLNLIIIDIDDNHRIYNYIFTEEFLNCEKMVFQIYKNNSCKPIYILV